MKCLLIILEDLKNSHSYKLNFISTPLDFNSAKFLGKVADAIKISSGDNNFLDIIDLCLGYNENYCFFRSLRSQ